MNHFILTESEFFQQINNHTDSQTLPEAYNGFITRVIELCQDVQNVKCTAIALMYAEIELQFHHTQDDEVGLYVRKAHTFIKKMQRYIATIATQMSPLTSIPNTEEATPALQWTGNAIDLVELIYAL